ncbi:Permease of the major facilitator superfamily [Pseudomonas coronafaciens pv. atropurpurea]|nr:Permease of the major facilitator superfamily [Pseudomonas coronafaciens pv. atropurpurea]RMT62848.1 Permease of the major facilitator superfamily [Pseudomonas coronafaciens pv. atropurpurea]
MSAVYICRCGNIHHCVRCPPKTLYNYTIKTDCAHPDYYLHYPDFASSLFKGIAIAVIPVFVLIAALTGSILFLIGPVAVAFVAAVKLPNWENPFTTNKACHGANITTSPSTASV